MKFFLVAALVVTTTNAFQSAPTNRPSVSHLASVSTPEGDEPSVDMSRNQFLQTGVIAALSAGATAFGSTLLEKKTVDVPSEFITETGTTAGLTDPKLNTLTPEEVAGLFGQWNNALLTGNPDTVTKRYAKGAVLLPTKSDIPRTDYKGIRDYFVKFLAKKPTGTIIESYVQTQPNYAVDVGIYEFKFEDGQRIRARYSFLYTKEDGCWKIKHHHSSAMPETKAVDISQYI